MSNKMSVTLFNQRTSESVVTLYSDLNANPVKNGSPLATNLKAVQQSLDNLFSTEQFERPFQPEYYSPIFDVIGELAVGATTAALSSAIYKKIQRFEPRIVYDNSASSITALTQENAYDVNVVFRMKGNVDSNSYNYNVRLYRTVT